MSIPDRSARQIFEVTREGGGSRAALAVSACDWTTLVARSGDFLHAEEARHLKRAGVPRRQADFLRGRCCAKLALNGLQAEVAAPSICVEGGVFGQPVVRGGLIPNAAVSIAHCDGWAAALAFDEGHPMGVDIELNDGRHDEVLRREALGSEVSAFATAGLPESVTWTLLWTAKEALAKVLRTGLMAPLSFYEMSEVEREGFGFVCHYRHFAQYKCYCGMQGDVALAIAIPRKSFLQFDSRILTVAAR